MGMIAHEPPLGWGVPAKPAPYCMLLTKTVTVSLQAASLAQWSICTLGPSVCDCSATVVKEHTVAWPAQKCHGVCLPRSAWAVWGILVTKWATLSIGFFGSMVLPCSVTVTVLLWIPSLFKLYQMALNVRLG